MLEGEPFDLSHLASYSPITVVSSAPSWMRFFGLQLRRVPRDSETDGDTPR